MQLRGFGDVPGRSSPTHQVDSTPVSNAKTLFDVNGDLDCEADAVSRVLQKIMFTRTGQFKQWSRDIGESPLHHYL